jgi:hypothetical protein
LAKVYANLAINRAPLRCRQAFEASGHARKNLAQRLAIPHLKDVQSALFHSPGASVGGDERMLEDIRGSFLLKVQLLDEDTARHFQVAWPFLNL